MVNVVLTAYFFILLFTNSVNAQIKLPSLVRDRFGANLYNKEGLPASPFRTDE